MTKKVEKKPIFEILFESEICFAVCVATSKFINREVAAFSKDYFVIINKCDKERVKELNFYPTEGHKYVCQRSLSEAEVRIFRNHHKSKFAKVLTCDDGSVYEPIGKPFNIQKTYATLNRMNKLADRG